MLIIFEGADGSGKSTYINELDYKLRCTNYVVKDAQDMIPTKPFEPNRVTDVYLLDKLSTMALDKQRIFLMDRGPISDIIYRLFDNYDSVATTKQLINLFVELQKYIIIVYAKTKDAFGYMQARGDDNQVAINNHANICKAYDIFFTMLKMILPFNVIDYDFTDKHSVKEATNKIALWAKLILEE